MKYALIFALLGLVFWFWRSQRLSRKNESGSPAKSAASAASAAAGPATEIVACSVCRLHLPRQEALLGQKGQYCSEAHKQLAGD